jgi:hypothetical protein
MPSGRLRIHEDYDHFCHLQHAGAIARQVADQVASLQVTVGTTGELQ